MMRFLVLFIIVSALNAVTLSGQAHGISMTVAERGEHAQHVMHADMQDSSQVCAESTPCFDNFALCAFVCTNVWAMGQWRDATAIHLGRSVEFRLPLDRKRDLAAPELQDRPPIGRFS